MCKMIMDAMEWNVSHMVRRYHFNRLRLKDHRCHSPGLPRMVPLCFEGVENERFAVWNG